MNLLLSNQNKTFNLPYIYYMDTFRSVSSLHRLHDSDGLKSISDDSEFAGEFLDIVGDVI